MVHLYRGGYLVDAEKTHKQKPKATAKRVRSTSFPYNSLPECVAYAKEFAKYGDEINIASLATILGHQSPKSGTFLQKLSSLRNWHLLEGRGAVLTVTDLSRRLANPIDDEQYKASIREAFELSKVFRGFLDGLAPGSEFKLHSIGNLAVQKYGVSDKARDDFVSSLVESAKAAGLIANVTDDGFLLSDVSELASSEKQTGTANIASGRNNTIQPRPPGRDLAPIVGSEWPFRDGAISFEIRSSKPLSASAYSFVADVVKSIEVLAREFGWDEDRLSDDSSSENVNGTAE